MSIGLTLKAPIEVRPVPKDDASTIAMIKANVERNAFDEGVLQYPAAELWTARSNGTVHAAMPLQKVYVLESVGTNPESSDQERAVALLELVKAASFEAYRDGCREIMFMSSDDVTAAGAMLLGFEEIKWRVYRRKL